MRTGGGLRPWREAGSPAVSRTLPPLLGSASSRFSRPVCKWHTHSTTQISGVWCQRLLGRRVPKNLPGESGSLSVTRGPGAHKTLSTPQQLLLIHSFCYPALLCVFCPGVPEWWPQWPCCLQECGDCARFPKAPPRGPRCRVLAAEGEARSYRRVQALVPDSAACLVLGTASRAFTPGPLPDPSSLLLQMSISPREPSVSSSPGHCPLHRTAHQAARAVL